MLWPHRPLQTGGYIISFAKLIILVFLIATLEVAVTYNEFFVPAAGTAFVLGLWFGTEVADRWSLPYKWIVLGFCILNIYRNPDQALCDICFLLGSVISFTLFKLLSWGTKK